MLAQHQRVRRNADRLRRHNLVAERITNHAVLVNARLVSESVASHDCLVWLYAEADDLRQRLAGRIKLSRIDLSLKGQTIRPDIHGHYHFFERGVAGAFADAVDGAFNLSRARSYRSQTVSDS